MRSGSAGFTVAIGLVFLLAAGVFGQQQAPLPPLPPPPPPQAQPQGGPAAPPGPNGPESIIDMPAIPTPNAEELEYQRGGQAYAERDFKTAEQIFRKLYQQKHDPRALIALAESIAAQRRIPEAIRLVEEGQREAPGFPQYHVALGNLYDRAKNYERAISEYRQALAMIPDNPYILNAIGSSQRKKGDYQGALASFTQVREMVPEDIGAAISVALVLEDLGQSAKSRAIYEEILKKEPNHPIALNNLAYGLAEGGGDLNRAMLMAQRALEQRPEDMHIADTLGTIYIRKGMADSAVKLFREIVQKEPDEAMYHFHLAESYALKGWKAEAKKSLEDAMRCQPGPEEMPKIRALQAKLAK